MTCSHSVLLNKNKKKEEEKKKTRLPLNSKKKIVEM